MRQSRILLLTSLLTLVVGSAQAQLSKYYITSGRAIDVLQNGALINSWLVHDPRGEDAIAIDGDVRTLGFRAPVTGAQYSLDGAPTGVIYPFPAGVGGGPSVQDGTTDGTHNYFVDYFSRVIFQANRDWTNPVALVPLPISGAIGVTYDPTNNSLWVTYLGNSFIFDYSMSGHQLSAFKAAVSSPTALALDPADNSLWFFDYDSRGTTETFYQYSKTGLLMSSKSHPAGVPNGAFFGGEFDLAPALAPKPLPPVTSTPEPASLSLLAIGVVGLGGVARWRSRRRPAGLRSPLAASLSR